MLNLINLNIWRQKNFTDKELGFFYAETERGVCKTICSDRRCIFPEDNSAKEGEVRYPFRPALQVLQGGENSTTERMEQEGKYIIQDITDAEFSELHKKEGKLPNVSDSNLDEKFNDFI